MGFEPATSRAREEQRETQPMVRGSPIPVSYPHSEEQKFVALFIVSIHNTNEQTIFFSVFQVSLYDFRVPFKAEQDSIG